jgi:hypothetical protein
MEKKPMVIRNRLVEIVAKKNFFRIYHEQGRYIVAYRHISALFIDSKVKVDLKSLMRLSENFDIHLIDARGYIRTTIRRG